MTSRKRKVNGAAASESSPKRAKMGRLSEGVRAEGSKVPNVSEVNKNGTSVVLQLSTPAQMSMLQQTVLRHLPIQEIHLPFPLHTSLSLA